MFIVLNLIPSIESISSSNHYNCNYAIGTLTVLHQIFHYISKEFKLSVVTSIILLKIIILKKWVNEYILIIIII